MGALLQTWSAIASSRLNARANALAASASWADSTDTTIRLNSPASGAITGLLPDESVTHPSASETELESISAQNSSQHLQQTLGAIPAHGLRHPLLQRLLRAPAQVPRRLRRAAAPGLLRHLQRLVAAEHRPLPRQRRRVLH